MQAGAGSSGCVQRQLYRKSHCICGVFPMSSKSFLHANKVIIFILNLLVFFGEHDIGDGLGTSTCKPFLGVLV